MPLLDCATLVAAAELGFAAAEGLELNLLRETSWANIRDRVIVGHFDAAHMLGPMTVASTLGIGHLTVPMIAPIALGLGGNAITVSAELWARMMAHGAIAGGDALLQGGALKRVIAENAARGAEQLTFAMVYPFSAHNYELRYWLAASGIDPDRDVRLVVIPPPLLVDALRGNQVQGFCVGEPWNSLAVDAGAGRIVIPTGAIWLRAPEKVLGCRGDWAAAHPEVCASLIRAIYRAALWCDDPAHHRELALLLAEQRYVGAPAEMLYAALSAPADFLVLARHHATFPWASHALWFYSQMVRWGQARLNREATRAARLTYRPDLYRAAVATVAGELPAADFKTETGFFDRQTFAADEIEAYVAVHPASVEAHSS